MSIQLGDFPVHYPAKPDKFEFDEEVSSIFDDMASRAIPMYHVAHSLQVAILLNHWRTTSELGKHFHVLDVGSSTGKLFVEVCNQLRIPPTKHPSKIIGVAVDSSPSMIAQLRHKVPWVVPVQGDVMDLEALSQRYDAINASYILQFVPPHKKKDVVRVLHSLLKPDGILLMSQKDQLRSPYADVMYEQYTQFKVGNGYTRAEIDAKTRALENSMWTITTEDLHDMLWDQGFGQLQETTRWSCFSSLVCRRLPDA